MVACKATYLPLRLMSSLCVPCSTTLPSSNTTILSAFRIVDSRWAITIVVLLLLASRSSSAACTMRSLSLSSADVASSSSRMEGSFTMARAIATRCFCPPDSCDPDPTSVS
mmetsp:Transcript_10375/g.17828  ORF Transcript_10375/g.17828 Transcript_10375/m.17828 type:complete len:111 (-) Transcript_10375:826-1158(-)